MPSSLDRGEGSSFLGGPSDASFSFQIPNMTRLDNLMADESTDFFDGVDDVLATPAPFKFNRSDAPLALDAITPRRSARIRNKTPSTSKIPFPTTVLPQSGKPAQRSPRKKSRQSGIIKPTPQKATTRLMGMFPSPTAIPESPAGERIDKLKLQLDSFANELREDSEASSLQAALAAATIGTSREVQSQTVNETMDQDDPMAGNDEPSVPDQPNETNTFEAVDEPQQDDSLTPEPQAPSLSEPSPGPREPSPAPTTPEPSPIQPPTPKPATLTLPIPNERAIEHISPQPEEPAMSKSPLSVPGGQQSIPESKDPLTLFQVTSEKPKPEPRRTRSSRAPIDPRPAPVAGPSSSRKNPAETASAKPKAKPVAPSNKRPAPAVLDEPRARKRVKSNAPLPPPPAPAKPSVRPTAPAKPAPPPPKKLLTSRRRTSTSKPAVPALSAAKAKGKGKAAILGSGAAKAATSLKAKRLQKSATSVAKPPFDASASSSSRPEPAKRSAARSVTKPTSSSAPGPEASVASGSRLTRSTTRATVPSEFRFQVDARLEARKNDFKDSISAPHDPDVPDFKALHAAKAAQDANRKAAIQTTVPRPPKLELDSRLKERAKFEEQIREKEMQRHLELEQKRRERQEEEEREIRELRQKAIPKANEVPEWYKDAPKKA